MFQKICARLKIFVDLKFYKLKMQAPNPITNAGTPGKKINKECSNRRKKVNNANKLKINNLIAGIPRPALLHADRTATQVTQVNIFISILLNMIVNIILKKIVNIILNMIVNIILNMIVNIILNMIVIIIMNMIVKIILNMIFNILLNMIVTTMMTMVRSRGKRRKWLCESRLWRRL